MLTAIKGTLSPVNSYLLLNITDSVSSLGLADFLSLTNPPTPPALQPEGILFQDGSSMDAEILVASRGKGRRKKDRGRLLRLVPGGV